MLRTAPLHNDLLLRVTKLMGRIRSMLVLIIAADKSDYTPVQNNNSSTAYYELLKAFNVGFKV